MLTIKKFKKIEYKILNIVPYQLSKISVDSSVLRIESNCI